MRFSKVLLAAGIGLLAVSRSVAGPSAGAAIAELHEVASVGSRGGRMIDGAPLNRPALTVDVSGAGAFGGRVPRVTAQDSQGDKKSKQEPFVPDPEEMKEATAYQDECTGFMSCLGSAVSTPIKLPFEMAAMGGVLGADIGSGLAWAPGGIILGVLGAVVGFATGLILAPIAFLGGIFKAFKKL